MALLLSRCFEDDERALSGDAADFLDDDDDFFELRCLERLRRRRRLELLLLLESEPEADDDEEDDDEDEEDEDDEEEDDEDEELEDERERCCFFLARFLASSSLEVRFLSSVADVRFLAFSSYTSWSWREEDDLRFLLDSSWRPADDLGAVVLLLLVATFFTGVESRSGAES